MKKYPIFLILGILLIPFSLAVCVDVENCDNTDCHWDADAIACDGLTNKYVCDNTRSSYSTNECWETCITISNLCDGGESSIDMDVIWLWDSSSGSYDRTPLYDETLWGVADRNCSFGDTTRYAATGGFCGLSDYADPKSSTVEVNDYNDNEFNSATGDTWTISLKAQEDQATKYRMYDNPTAYPLVYEPPYSPWHAWTIMEYYVGWPNTHANWSGTMDNICTTDLCYVDGDRLDETQTFLNINLDYCDVYFTAKNENQIQTEIMKKNPVLVLMSGDAHGLISDCTSWGYGCGSTWNHQYMIIGYDSISDVYVMYDGHNHIQNFTSVEFNNYWDAGNVVSFDCTTTAVLTPVGGFDDGGTRKVYIDNTLYYSLSSDSTGYGFNETHYDDGDDGIWDLNGTQNTFYYINTTIPPNVCKGDANVTTLRGNITGKSHSGTTTDDYQVVCKGAGVACADSQADYQCCTGNTCDSDDGGSTFECYALSIGANISSSTTDHDIDDDFNIISYDIFGLDPSNSVIDSLGLYSGPDYACWDIGLDSTYDYCYTDSCTEGAQTICRDFCDNINIECSAGGWDTIVDLRYNDTISLFVGLKLGLSVFTAPACVYNFYVSDTVSATMYWTNPSIIVNINHSGSDDDTNDDWIVNMNETISFNATESSSTGINTGNDIAFACWDNTNDGELDSCYTNHSVTLCADVCPGAFNEYNKPWTQLHNITNDLVGGNNTIRLVVGTAYGEWNDTTTQWAYWVPPTIIANVTPSPYDDDENDNWKVVINRTIGLNPNSSNVSYTGDYIACSCWDNTSDGVWDVGYGSIATCGTGESGFSSCGITADYRGGNWSTIYNITKIIPQKINITLRVQARYSNITAQVIQEIEFLSIINATPSVVLVNDGNSDNTTNWNVTKGYGNYFSMSLRNSTLGDEEISVACIRILIVANDTIHCWSKNNLSSIDCNVLGCNVTGYNNSDNPQNETAYINYSITGDFSLYLSGFYNSSLWFTFPYTIQYSVSDKYNNSDLRTDGSAQFVGICNDTEWDNDEDSYDYGGKCGTCNDDTLNKYLGEFEADYGGVCGYCSDTKIKSRDLFFRYIDKTQFNVHEYGRGFVERDITPDSEMCMISKGKITGGAVIGVIIIILLIIIFIIIFILFIIIIISVAGPVIVAMRALLYLIRKAMRGFRKR